MGSPMALGVFDVSNLTLHYLVRIDADTLQPTIIDIIEDWDGDSRGTAREPRWHFPF